MKIYSAYVEIVEAPEENVKWGVTVVVRDRKSREYALGAKFTSKRAASSAKLLIEATLRTILYGPKRKES